MSVPGPTATARVPGPPLIRPPPSHSRVGPSRSSCSCRHRKSASRSGHSRVGCAGCAFLRDRKTNTEQKAEGTPEGRGPRQRCLHLRRSCSLRPTSRLWSACASRPAHEYLYSLYLISAPFWNRQSLGDRAESMRSQGSAFLKEVRSYATASLALGGWRV